MSVAQLYHHLAPRSDVSIVAKSLIRLLRSYREVQSIVLNSIASISIPRKVSYYYLLIMIIYHIYMGIMSRIRSRLFGKWLTEQSTWYIPRI